MSAPSRLPRPGDRKLLRGLRRRDPRTAERWEVTVPGEPPRGGGGEGPEPLSEEEIRGLLGDRDDVPLGEAEPASGPGRSREPGDGARQGGTILVVARDDDEGRMVRAGLAGLGAEVDWVRNPFAALDQLRRRHYAAVVSNFEMWADQGALLFQRLAQRGSRTRVVFLCPGAEAAERAREAGADAALRRPLDASGLESILGLLRPFQESRTEAGPTRLAETAARSGAE